MWSTITVLSRGGGGAMVWSFPAKNKPRLLIVIVVHLLAWLGYSKCFTPWHNVVDIKTRHKPHFNSFLQQNTSVLKLFRDQGLVVHKILCPNLFRDSRCVQKKVKIQGSGVGQEHSGAVFSSITARRSWLHCETRPNGSSFSEAPLRVYHVYLSFHCKKKEKRCSWTSGNENGALNVSVVQEVL